MPLPVFQILCAAVILATLTWMARDVPPRRLLADYFLLAVAGWIGEESMIAAYGFYAYADGWHGFVFQVPILIPLIWPLVILSARQVVSFLWPDAARSRALLVGAVVAFDASLMEVIAVSAGYWTWIEPGHLGVPLIGILGWGFFAAGVELLLERRGWRRLAIIAAAPALAHLLVLASWWGALRWILRGDLGLASLVGFALAGGSALALVAAARRRGRAMPPAAWVPRIFATALFVALLAYAAPTEAPLWVHTAAIGAPYLLATRLTRGRRSPADLPLATPPFLRGTGGAARSQGG